MTPGIKSRCTTRWYRCLSSVIRLVARATRRRPHDQWCLRRVCGGTTPDWTRRADHSLVTAAGLRGGTPGTHPRCGMLRPTHLRQAKNALCHPTVHGPHRRLTSYCPPRGCDAHRPCLESGTRRCAFGDRGNARCRVPEEYMAHYSARVPLQRSQTRPCALVSCQAMSMRRAMCRRRVQATELRCGSARTWLNRTLRQRLRDTIGHSLVGERTAAQRTSVREHGRARWKWQATEGHHVLHENQTHAHAQTQYLYAAHRRWHLV